MLANKDACYSFTFLMEGDEEVSLNVSDPGNWSSGVKGVGEMIGTKFGVSAPELISWMKGTEVTRAIMAGITKETAEAILSARYWNVLDCNELWCGVDLSVLDHGFNGGDSASAKIFQTIIGAKPDGYIGEKSLAAMQAFDRTKHYRLSGYAVTQLQIVLGWRVGAGADGGFGTLTLGRLNQSDSADQMILCCALYDAQLAAYKSMGNFPTFGNGWTNRCEKRLTAALGLLTTEQQITTV